MAPRLEEVAPLVGEDVYDEYGRTIGVLVSFSSNVDGIVEYVEVKIADRTLERIPGDRTRVKAGRLVVTPEWKYKAVRIIEALDRAYRRRSALEQLTGADIPGPVVEGMKRKLEEEIKRLRVKAEESLSEISERLAKIEDEALHIASAIAQLQMAYFSGEIGDRSYEHGHNHLRKIRKALMSEKEDAKNVHNKLDKTLKALVSVKPKTPVPAQPATHTTPEPAHPAKPMVTAAPSKQVQSPIMKVKIED